MAEIPRVSVLSHCPYSVTFPYIAAFKFINNLYAFIRYIMICRCNIMYFLNTNVFICNI